MSIHTYKHYDSFSGWFNNLISVLLVIRRVFIFLLLKELFSFQNNTKNLEPSYKTDPDLWNCLGRVKFVL